MRKSCAGQSEYAWTCFIISSFILTSLVDSQPSLDTTSASDVISREEQTTRAIHDQGQTIRATLGPWQTTRATLDQKETIRSTLDHRQTIRATLDQELTTRATLDQEQITRARLDQRQTTRATLDQGQTRNIIQEKKTAVVWQSFPFLASENDEEDNSSVNLTAYSYSMDGNKDELTTDDSAWKSDKDFISNGGKKNKREDDNINELDSSSGKAFTNNNSNINNKSNNSSNNNNHNTDLSCSSKDCIHPFHSHNLKERSSNKNEKNINTTSYDENNNGNDFYFYDDYYNSNITTDIDDVSTIHGQTNNQTIRPTTTMSSTPYALSELENIYFSLYWYTTLVIQPILGLLGLTGNILSGIVATKSGLNKATNIFILALALADSISLIHSINVAKILQLFPNYFPWYYLVWEYPPTLAYFFFVIKILAENVLRISGYFISGYICTLITTERVLAVYFPLRFKSIMTPRRAWVCVVCFFLSWISWAVFHPAVSERLKIYYFPSLNIYASQISPENSDLLINIDGYFVTPVGKILPIIVTIAGSILIGVKVRDAQRKRKTMTIVSKKSVSWSRTTKTLMLVCGFFVATQCVALPIFVFVYVLKDDIYTKIFLNLYNEVQSINASSNFIIYVVFNNKFRAELKRLFSCCNKVLHKQNGSRYTSCTTTSQLH